MKERQYLKKEIRLCGESDGNPFTRRFTIVKKSDEGSSSVCYEAYHGNSGRGMLKEFYPRGPYGLERTKEGQLICVGGDEASQRRFREAEKEYLRPYEMLLEAKQGGDNKDLSAFIPPFEIYHGCDEDGKIIGTTYIWTPQPDLETFKKICDEIHRHPRKNPEHKLVTVLSAIDSLTKCVCALHAAGMVHRDINPSNFGFTKLGNETLMQIPTLFDINSVCSVYGDMEDVVGTEGFLEPEAGRRAATNQTDIYSIGATLFFAIVVTDETKSRGYIYRSEYYDRILEMVDDSDLIRASEANSHPRLRAILTRILGKSLCRAEDRYANCEEMIEDLEDALYYALPSDIANKGRAGEKWVLKDMEKSLDVNKGKNSFLAIQYHLYEHPLYQCCADGKGMLRVIVIGFGNYGQKFLDACLQDGQIRGMSLQVTVFSDDPTDKDIYLSERPSLAKFFNVGGSIEKGMDSYGSIEFETEKLGRDKGTDNTSIMEKLMCDQSESDCGCPRYVFIALGDDSLNHAAADACKNAAEILEMKCTISFICEGDRLAGEDEPNLCPLHINRDIKKSPLYPEIERMAFNAHMVWEKDLNIDFGTVRAEFRKKYNHDSCVSNVLSLKYKLYSMGIDLDAIGFEEAAQQFEEKMGNGLNHKMRDELICIEHRRWVTEKLCLGWSRIDDLSECAGGMTKDEKKKRHVCIVRSRPDQMLAKEYGYGKNANHKKWDKLSKTELDKLDELDRMSVELHKMFEKEARAAKKQNLLYGNIMAGIRE
ncbi:MAG: hypothetical protein LUI02_02690, partial [Clostridiales bacterium]|nr:hypothetical protein [Clostridiales bacterium]